MSEPCVFAEPLTQEVALRGTWEWPFSLPMAKWPLFNTAVRN